MDIPTPQQVGTIVTRLAMADEAFLAAMLQAAHMAGDRLLPDDAHTLVNWSRFIRMVRAIAVVKPPPSA